MDIEQKLLPYQYDILQSNARTIAFSGGIGSAKTYTGCLKTIVNLLQEHRSLLITPTHATARDTHFLQMQEILDAWKVKHKVNKTLLEIEIASRKGKLFVKSEENKETINGLTKISFLCVDECRLISERAYTYGLSRMRNLPAGVKPQILLIGTGCSKSHWFAKEAMADTTYWIKKNYKDNPFNGKEYIELLEEKYKNLDENFKRRELYGEFTDNAEGSLFNDINFSAYNGDLKTFAGLDIAINGGGDYSTVAILKGNKLIYFGKRKTLGMNELIAWKNELTFRFNVHSWAHDHTGLGNDLTVPESIPIFFGAPAAYPYANKRVEIYYALKDLLGGGGMCIENTEFMKLFNEECVPELELTRVLDKDSRNLQLCPKDEIRNALGRSPDLSDALALAAYCQKIDGNGIDFAQMRSMQRVNNPFAQSLLRR